MLRGRTTPHTKVRHVIGSSLSHWPGPNEISFALKLQKLCLRTRCGFQSIIRMVRNFGQIRSHTLETHRACLGTAEYTPVNSTVSSSITLHFNLITSSSSFSTSTSCIGNLLIMTFTPFKHSILAQSNSCLGFSSQFALTQTLLWPPTKIHSMAFTCSGSRPHGQLFQ